MNSEAETPISLVLLYDNTSNEHPYYDGYHFRKMKLLSCSKESFLRWKGFDDSNSLQFECTQSGTFLVTDITTKSETMEGRYLTCQGKSYYLKPTVGLKIVFQAEQGDTIQIGSLTSLIHLSMKLEKVFEIVDDHC